jgi:hypothetical protein
MVDGGCPIDRAVAGAAVAAAPVRAGASLIELRADETVADRPFAALDRTAEDGEVLRRMWARLRTHVQGLGVATDHPTHRLDRVTDAAGSVHTMVLPNLRRAMATDDLFGVGFFGQARSQVDHTPIIELEAALIADMPSTPGLVAYYNAFDPSAGWATSCCSRIRASNEPGVATRAMSMRCVGRPLITTRSDCTMRVPSAGCSAGGPIEIVRTRYIDFADDPPWRATREIAG